VPTLQIRPDIREKYAVLFGAHPVNSRTVVVEDIIADMTAAVSAELPKLLADRHAVLERVAEGKACWSFLPATEEVSDADGNKTTVARIRQGMLDGFFGRRSTDAWSTGASVPVPADTMRPGLEGTGPAIDMGMAMGALNSGASQWMWDWEDAGGDYKDQLYQAWVNLRDILARRWDGTPFVHPTKKRTYTIDTPHAQWPIILHRVAGIHLRNRQMWLDGEPVPAIIPGLVIHAVHNYNTQKKNGSGIYYYIPKLETWQEARLVAKLLKLLEAAIGVPRGTIKVKLLNERAEFMLQQEAIMWVLRENMVGPNVGRWDYINSREEMFRHDPKMVIPDPHTVTMGEPSMSYYTRRNALLATLCGAMPIGGMAAQMQNPHAPENDAKALRDIWVDKLRERLTGIFKIDGKVYDTYRQSWVATVQKDYVGAGKEPLVTDLADLQKVVDKTTQDERDRLEGLGLLTGGKIQPMELTAADLTVEKLWTNEAIDRLLARPKGPTTEDGLRYAMYMATEYMYQQLQGNNAAAIFDPKTGLRFMNDFATYEIFWHFLYLATYHNVELTADGELSKKGDRVTPEFFVKLIDARRDTVKELFKKLNIVYEQTHAELVLQVLQRQVVAKKDGKLVPQPRWIKYGSRVLLAIIEQPPADRDAILDAILSDRQDVAGKLSRATDLAERARLQKALDAHDYVHDVPHVEVAGSR
jgi:malate synthase